MPFAKVCLLLPTFWPPLFNFLPIFSKIPYLNLCHRDLIILCIHLLIIAKDVSQLIIVLVLVLVEDLKVDCL